MLCCLVFEFAGDLFIKQSGYNQLLKLFQTIRTICEKFDFSISASTASELPTVISSSRSSESSESSFPCLEWHDGFAQWPIFEKVEMCWKIADIFLFCNHHCPRCGICPNRPVLVFLKAFIPSMSLIIYIRYDRSSILCILTSWSGNILVEMPSHISTRTVVADRNCSPLLSLSINPILLKTSTCRFSICHGWCKPHQPQHNPTYGCLSRQPGGVSC